jgi:hypothetical protein
MGSSIGRSSRHEAIGPEPTLPMMEQADYPQLTDDSP